MYTHEGRSKSFIPDTERRAIAENVCFGNTVALFMKLEKLIQIASNLIYIYICVCVCVCVLPNLRT